MRDPYYPHALALLQPRRLWIRMCYSREIMGWLQPGRKINHLNLHVLLGNCGVLRYKHIARSYLTAEEEERSSYM